MASQDQPEHLPHDDHLRRRDVRSALNELRKKLLDLTGRNPLLNYRHTGTARQVRLVNVSLTEVLTALASTKPHVVHALPETALLGSKLAPDIAAQLDRARGTDIEYRKALESAGDNHEAAALAEDALLKKFCSERGLAVPSGKRSTVSEVASKYAIVADFDLAIDRPSADSGKPRPIQFQTLLFPDVYERRLSKVRADARTSEQELGFNTLYAAIGFLEWYESEASSKAILSPLLLVPVQIDRIIERGRYVYTIAGRDDDPEINVTLSERFTADFALSLPTFGPDTSLKEYFESVKDAVRDYPRFVIRGFATIGTFNFSRLALYKDLAPTDDSSFPDIDEHPVVSSLLAGTPDRDGLLVGSDEGSDSESYRLSSTPYLITDADSTQYAAILDVAKGRSLVIEGPPGTGKSQTITNVIAAVLGQGKTVLFVAEKAAALNVVKARLSAAGLGDFCLELHSTKASKAEIHNALRQRLRLRPTSAGEVEESLALARREASTIERYCEGMHTQLPSGLRRSLHDLVWRQERLRQELGDGRTRLYDPVNIPNAETFTSVDVAEYADLIEAWIRERSGLLASFPSIEEHPLIRIESWVTLSDQFCSEMHSLLVACFDAISHLKEVFSDVRIIATLVERPLSEVSKYVDLSTRLDSIQIPKDVTLSQFWPLEDPVTLRAILSDLDELMAATRSIGAVYVDAITRLEAQCRIFVSTSVLAGLDDSTTYIALHAQLSQYEAREASIEASKALLTELEELTGTTRIDGNFFVASEAAFRIIGATSRGDLNQRFLPSLEALNIGVLRELARAVDDLQKRSASIAEVIDVSHYQDVEALSVDAKALGSDGIFRAFDGKFKSARKRFEAARLSEGAFRANEAAAVLKDLLVLKNDWMGLSDGANWAAVAGPLLQGEKTDFERLTRVITLNERLDQDLSALGRHGTALAAFVRGVAIEKLDRFREIVSSQQYSAVQALLEEHGDLQTASLVTIAKHNALQAAHDAWPLEGGIEALSFGAIREALGVVERRKYVTQSFRAHRQLRVLVEDDNANGSQTISDYARDTLRAVLDIIHAVETLCAPSDVGAIIAHDTKQLKSTLGKLRLSFESYGEKLLQSMRRINELGGLRHLSADASLTTMLSEIVLLQLGLRDATAWRKFRRLDERIKIAGLSAFVNVEVQHDSNLQVPRALEYVIIRSAIGAVRDRSDSLSELNGSILHGARTRFARFDKELLVRQRDSLRNALLLRKMPEGNSSGPRSTWTDRRLIDLELGKQQRHASMRDFFRRAGGAIQALAPCIMMSPLSVAQYVPQGALEFDVIVIDEASQMRPEDALSAISRGKQLVVVGDPKQLPPTAFFGRAEVGDVEDEDSVDTESILDLASQQFGRPRRLLWHYRSRNPALIAFSNQEFYDNELLLFPTPEADRRDAVEYFFCGGVYRSRINEVEAQQIVEAACRHMQERPDRSLAIVTMNKPQQEFIDDLMQLREKNDSAVAAYVERWVGTGQDFIIKNLETVQGDERDVILVSTVYGPDQIGGRTAQRFGPINSPSGWRRLNVLFTRAKHRIEVYSSMRSADIETFDGNASAGVRALAGYLEYVASGSLPNGTPTGREPDSDFEVSVATMLRARGFQVVPQVGVAGFFIDLAVVDPRNSSRYLLGIECDGRAYHSTKAARDRDRLREEILSGMGWQLARVWSTDWFSNPRRESDRLASAIQAAMKGTLN